MSPPLACRWGVNLATHIPRQKKIETVAKGLFFIALQIILPKITNPKQNLTWDDLFKYQKFFYFFNTLIFILPKSIPPSSELIDQGELLPPNIFLSSIKITYFQQSLIDYIIER